MKWSAAACLLTLLGILTAYAAAEQQKPVSNQDPMMRTGQAIYVDNCSACHTESGTGISQLFPALRSDPVVLSADPDGLIHIVLEGTKSAATDHAPTGASMPALGWKLSNEQIAAVITYVRNSWGNAAPAVSLGDVRRARQKDCSGLESRLHLQSYFDYFCKQPDSLSGQSGTVGAGRPK